MRSNNRAVGPFGDAAMLILTSLADGPKHGYALIQDIERYCGLLLSAGTLYAALNRLENRGLVEALPPEERRRPFRLTAAGEVVLRDHLRSLQQVAATAQARLRPSMTGF